MRRTSAAHLRMASTSLAAFAAARWTRPFVLESLLGREPLVGERPGGSGAEATRSAAGYALAAAARRLEALHFEIKDLRELLEAEPAPPQVAAKPTPSFVSFSLDDDADDDAASRKPSTISPLVDFYRDRALAAEREIKRRGTGAPVSNEHHTGLI